MLKRGFIEVYSERIDEMLRNSTCTTSYSRGHISDASSEPQTAYHLHLHLDFLFKT
jgi:hypothetical protein